MRLVLVVVTLFVMLRIRRPLRSTLFPYTTLFRSGEAMGSLILVVEDDPDVATVLSDRLQAMGHEVMTVAQEDRKSTRLNSSHGSISYAVFCLKKKKKQQAPII